ncbi:anti-repressor SinI family protein [Priestia aryabhattai]|nr:anti-repressor SinI family protein [Priestia aryabhattai]MED4003710.1 anti-repressor SinI family protein [Priestia aryabhattai]
MDKKEKEPLPKEWMDLVKEAMESNISQKEFKQFLDQYAKKVKHKKK